MSFLNMAQSRYTTKKYDDSKNVSPEKIEELKQILRLSPSSINSQPWHFYFISDEEVKRRLAAVSKYNEPKINAASHLVVFTVKDDVAAFENQLPSYLPESAVAYFNENLKPLPQNEIQAWMAHQVYLSLGFFLAACGSLHVDSTPMEGIQAREYDRILNLSGHKTLFAVALGGRDDEDANQIGFKPKSRRSADDVITSI